MDGGNTGLYEKCMARHEARQHTQYPKTVTQHGTDNERAVRSRRVPHWGRMAR